MPGAAADRLGAGDQQHSGGDGDSRAGGMSGRALGDHALSESVMQLEQRMTTGGGWQDQAGGIFPGAKLLITGPGLRQRIRVQPVVWSEARRAEFCERMVLYNTGIQRVAKDLLRQVVSRYLARETATIQVLHSIKTLAVEMSYAMAEGDWKHLGELLDRHWQLNQRARSAYDECADQCDSRPGAAVHLWSQAGWRGWRRISDDAGPRCRGCHRAAGRVDAGSAGRRHVCVLPAGGGGAASEGQR